MNLGIVSPPETEWLLAVEQYGTTAIEWASVNPTLALSLVSWTVASTLFKLYFGKRAVSWCVGKWKGRKA